MGSGKSTIAKRLSKQLNRPLIEMDELIEKRANQTITDIFKNKGEEYFRQLESDLCKEISGSEGCIISTGGGVVLNPVNVEYLRQNGIIIYLNRPVDKILNDLKTSNRPLIKNDPNKLYDLYDYRHKLYVKACNYHLHNIGGLDEIINEIKEVIPK